MDCTSSTENQPNTISKAEDKDKKDKKEEKEDADKKDTKKDNQLQDAIEAIWVRYDIDNSGWLSKSEVETLLADSLKHMGRENSLSQEQLN